jgi:tetratricopeptide (TPR) repeat protein
VVHTSFWSRAAAPIVAGACAAAVVVAAGLWATGLQSPKASARPGADEFWAAIADPRGAHVAYILGLARTLQAQASRHFPAPARASPRHDELQQARRTQQLNEARLMLNHAAELAPADPEVRLEQARVADQLGQYQQAVGHLQGFLRLAGARHHDREEALLRLGRSLARLDRWDEAIFQLENALRVPHGRFTDHALLSLGCAYMHEGRLGEAIDLLAQAAQVPTTAGGGDSAEMLAGFALAVAYDRDEQITRAYSVLERLRAHDASLEYVIQSPYAASNAGQLQVEPLLWPAHERHYFEALRYEAQAPGGLTGSPLPEARAHWHAYLRAVGPDHRFAARARAHIAAIDDALAVAMRNSKKVMPRRTRPAPPAAAATESP